jgi:hypothetical protein
MMLDVNLSTAHNSSMTPAAKRRDSIAAEVRIRLAYPDDRTLLERLATLDSQEPLEAHVLIAEIEGVAVAALSLRSGRVIADPFVPTESVVDLLRVRASRATPGPKARRFFRRPRPATAGA